MATFAETRAVENLQTYQEEFPVTFQLGLVGSDGVLLASDKLITNLDPIRTRSLTNKIEVREDEGLAYCWAGDDLCSVVMKDLRANLKTAPSPLMQDAMIETAQLRGGRLRFPSSILIVRQSDRAVQLWKFEVPSGGAFVVQDKVTVGDTANPAAFLTEKYFPKCRRPIGDLLPLAAHTVLMAGELHPGGISGLEIVLCRASGFERLPEEELQRLADNSKALDSQIATSLGL